MPDQRVIKKFPELRFDDEPLFNIEKNLGKSLLPRTAENAGHTTRQIAGTLTLSIKTIESHLEHIKNKLTIQSSAELAHRATRWVETGCAS